MIDPVLARRGLYLVFFIMLFDMMGLAIIMPVLPAYLKELTGSTLSEAAIEGGWLFLVYAAMQFFFGPFIGNLSDRFGRRPVLLASVLTFAIDNLICAIAPTYWVLFIGRVLAGISGASYATASAYIADISTDETRARNFGFIGIAFGVGFTLGPVIGGLLGEFGPRVPFYGAALLAFINFAVACFLLPETLAAESRRRFDWRRANPLGALKQLRRHKGIGWISALLFLFWLAHAVYPAVWSFATAYRYDWSEGQIGLSLGVFGVFSALSMGVVLPRFVARFGEWKTAAVGLAFATAGFIGYAVAWQGWMVYVVIFLASLESMADPSLRSIASAGVAQSEQGELQGALTSLSSITQIVGPLIFPLLFSAFTGPSAPFEFAGMSFAVAAAMCFSGLVILVSRVRPGLRLAPADVAHSS